MPQRVCVQSAASKSGTPQNWTSQNLALAQTICPPDLLPLQLSNFFSSIALPIRSFRQPHFRQPTFPRDRRRHRQQDACDVCLILSDDAGIDCDAQLCPRPIPSFSTSPGLRSFDCRLSWSSSCWAMPLLSCSHSPWDTRVNAASSIFPAPLPLCFRLETQLAH